MTGLRIFLASCCGLLSACAVTPPVTPPAAMCNIPRLKLEVEIPGRERASEAELVGQARHFASAGFAAAAEAPGEPNTLATELRRQLAGPGSRKRGGPGSMLFLSGGSQQGAFGAGFLNGWSEARGGDATRGALPEFTVVTGISTGAILSTWAFLNDPAPLAREYRISREEEILDPFVSGNAGSLKVATTLARRGALGDLTGLRRLLAENLSPAVLAAVGKANSDRKLYVGAVDVDSGQAVAFDMTQLAERYIDPAYAGQRQLIKNCYIEAIIASSAVPMAALPVFIDNRMYIDGGARFGIFSDEVGEAMRFQAALAKETRRPAPAIYAIVNGDLTVGERCAKADKSLCKPPHPPTGAAYGAHSDWKLDDLALRSVEIMIDQGYRFATSALRERARELDLPFKAAWIEADVGTHLYRLRDHGSAAYRPHPELGEGEMTCPDWEKFDEDKDHPLEFHPRYMHCLVDYGEKRGRGAGW